jgi:hypothetical protein
MLFGKKIPALLLTMVFGVAWLVLILLTPPERTLGTIIRWVFAHGSLTQASVYVFLIAALLAAGYLLGHGNLAVWMKMMGIVAFSLWVLGFVISMIPARMAWGVLVDFNEPRTQMTLRVIAVGVVFLVLVWWINQPRFTAIALIIFAFILLFLVRSTSLIRHPANPVGESPDRILPLLYLGITLSAVLAALSFTAWLVDRSSRKSLPQSQQA